MYVKKKKLQPTNESACLRVQSEQQKPVKQSVLCVRAAWKPIPPCCSPRNHARLSSGAKSGLLADRQRAGKQQIEEGGGNHSFQKFSSSSFSWHFLPPILQIYLSARSVSTTWRGDTCTGLDKVKVWNIPSPPTTEEHSPILPPAPNDRNLFTWKYYVSTSLLCSWKGGGVSFLNDSPHPKHKSQPTITFYKRRGAFRK